MLQLRRVRRIDHNGPVVLVDSGRAELLEGNLRTVVVKSERLVPSWQTRADSTRGVSREFDEVLLP